MRSQVNSASYPQRNRNEYWSKRHDALWLGSKGRMAHSICRLKRGPMPNVMATLPNAGGALCSTPQSLADAHYYMACSNAAKTRYQLKFAGGPKIPDRSQPLVGRSSPYCADICRTYCCLVSFFLIVDICLSCEDIARETCVMVRR